MYLFFDTETTGLPKNWKARMSDLDNWPRVIQLAWAIYDSKCELVSEHKYLISPDGWEVPVEPFWIENGFSTEICLSDGHNINEVLDSFLLSYDTCSYIISHNMEFDYNVLGSEMLRYKKKAQKKLVKICTKEVGTDFCNLPGAYNKPKWPKLSELHQKLFNESFPGAHDALADVKATARCFFGLKERGII